MHVKAFVLFWSSTEDNELNYVYTWIGRFTSHTGFEFPPTDTKSGANKNYVYISIKQVQFNFSYT